MNGLLNPMANKARMAKRSSYYRTIAKHFFEQRGAPFFLSSREFDRICRWEEMNIPLRVVLEGIKASFEDRKHKPGRRRRPYTLDYCHPAVVKAYMQHKERRIGGKKTDFGEKKGYRHKKILAEVDRFLEIIPENLGALKPVYSKIQKRLTAGKITDEELEEAEDVIEQIIAKNVSLGQKKTITAEIIHEFGVHSGIKFDQIFGMKVIKTMREKFKIPHVSPFYY